MSNSQRGFRHWLHIWWPVAVGIAIIAIESTEFMGADHTSGPLRSVWEFFFGRIGDDEWENVHHLIRKTGHFIGYGFIGLAWLRAWWMTLPRSRFLHDALLALLGTAIVASADEFHQTFLPNRTGRWQDALLDCGGAITLQAVVYVYMRIRAPKKLARVT